MKKYEKPVITEIRMDFSDVIQTSGEYLTDTVDPVNEKLAAYIGSTEVLSLFDK